MFKRFIVAFLCALFFVGAFAPTSGFAQATPGSNPNAPPPYVPGPSTNLIAPDSDGDGTAFKEFQVWEDYFTGVGDAGSVSCWGCKLFQYGANVSVEMSERGAQAFADPASKAVATFMGLWLMWQLYLMLSISHAVSPAQSIETIVQRLVIMMVVLFLLQGGYSTWILEPMYGIMADFMGTVSTIIGGTGQCSNGVVGGAGGAAAEYMKEGNGLICNMQQALGGGLAIGGFLFATAEFQLLTGVFEITQLLAGLIIFVVFAFMTVILPFRFFDAIVRIAIVVTIMPIVILSFLFKPTRGVVKQAVTSVLTAMLSFGFTAIAIAIASAFLTGVTDGMFSNFYDAPVSWFGRITAEDFMILLTAGLGMASMVQSAGTVAAEFAGFQGQMGNAGAAGSGAIGGAMSGATKLAAGGVAFAAAGGMAQKMAGNAAKTLADAGTATQAGSGGGGGDASAGGTASSSGDGESKA